jgi:multicomponent Na+:H+ antiporter subunit D
LWRAVLTLSAAALKLVVVLSMLPGSLAARSTSTTWSIFPPGIGIGFRGDGLGMFFALVSSTLWVMTTIYAIGYMQGRHARVRFFGFFALCVSTTVGLAFAENLLTLFLFYELLTICTYPLVIHDETPEAMKAGRKYLAYTLSGGMLVLLGVVLVQHLAGTLSLSMPGVLSLEAGRPMLAVTFLVLVAGFGVKAAIMPLHGWLPTAMVAPVPVSALLHAVAVVKAGVFGLLRVIYNVFGVDLLRARLRGLAGLFAGFTIIAASLMALAQDNLKLRLAYSTISQLSYIVLAASLLTPLAALAAIAHIANQAFAKITMFFVAGAIQRTTGRTQMHELAGIGRADALDHGRLHHRRAELHRHAAVRRLRHQVVPVARRPAGRRLVVRVLMVASSLLNAAYWLPILYLAWFRRRAGCRPAIREAPAMLLVPTLAQRGLRAPARHDRARPGHAFLAGAGGGALRHRHLAARSCWPTNFPTLLPALIVALPLAGRGAGLAAAPLGERGTRLLVLGALCGADDLLGVLATLVPGAAARRGGVGLGCCSSTPAGRLELRVDAMGALFALTVAVLFLLRWSTRRVHLRATARETRYYAFFMLCQALRCWPWHSPATW